MAKRRPRRTTAVDDSSRACPCGSAEAYRDCCAPMHRAQTTAATAEQLMRSRFSAYALGNTAYLLRTWHSATRPSTLTLDPGQRWTRLDIVGTERGGLFDTTGTVEFDAQYQESGRPAGLHERSRFVREGGRWVYLDALPQRP